MPQKLSKQRLVLLLIANFLLLGCTCFGINMTALMNRVNSAGDSNPAPAPPRFDCSAFHFTSPRDGLFNANNTFYWDPVPNAVSYRINIYSGAVRIATWDAASPATNLVGDASKNAIGGENPFQVEALAFDANGNFCRDYVAMNREWLPPNQPQPLPPPEEPPPYEPPTCGVAPGSDPCT